MTELRPAAVQAVVSRRLDIRGGRLRRYLDGIQDGRGWPGSLEALDRFERQTAWPMMALGLAIIRRSW